MYQNDFVIQSRELRSKGAQLDQLHQMAKGGGLAVAGLSGIALIASGGTLLPFIFGAITYASAVVSENKRTGKLCPLPWVSDDLAGMAAKSLNGHSPQALGTQAHHYLEPQDKALYYLTNFQGHRLTELSRQLEPDQFDHVVVNLADHLVTAHQSALNHPELLAQSLNIDFFNDAINALPTDQRESLPAVATQPRLPKPAHTEPAKEAGQLAIATPPSQNQPEIKASPEQSKTALELLLASPYTSRAIFGAQRTGKSYLAAVASRQMAQQGVNVFHINLCSYGGEDSEYWQHAKSVRADLACLSGAQAGLKIQDALQLVHEFFATENSLLIVDEFTYTGSSANAHADILAPLVSIIADKIATLASAGMKRRRAIWTIAPEMVADSLVKDAKSVKKLQLVLVSIAPGRLVDWHGQTVGFNAELFSQIKNNYPVDMPRVNAALAGQDRVVYINGSWVPVGVNGRSLKTINVAPVPLGDPWEDPTDFDSPVANVATAQALQATLTKADMLRAEHAKNDGLLWLLTYLERKQGAEILIRNLCKHPNAVKHGVSSQASMNELLTIFQGADLIGFVNDETIFVEGWR